MRKIHIRFRDPDNFSHEVLKEGDRLYWNICNSNGQQLLMVRPELRRKIVGGVYLQDYRGSMAKWFHDTDAGGQIDFSGQPVWG